MIDQAISPAMVVLIVVGFVATAASVGIAIAAALRILHEPFMCLLTRIVDHNRSPNTGDKVVGYSLCLVGIIYLLSDYANDFVRVVAS